MSCIRSSATRRGRCVLAIGLLTRAAILKCTRISTAPSCESSLRTACEFHSRVANWTCVRIFPYRVRLRRCCGARHSHSRLNREIDADDAHWRHSVGRVADAQETGTKPIEQTVDANGQKLHTVPAVQLVPAVSQVGRELHDRRAKSFEWLPAHLV